MRRLSVEELFPNGEPIGDETLRRKLDEAERRHLETSYRTAVAEEMLQLPEAT